MCSSLILTFLMPVVEGITFLVSGCCCYLCSLPYYLIENESSPFVKETSQFFGFLASVCIILAGFTNKNCLNKIGSVSCVIVCIEACVFGVAGVYCECTRLYPFLFGFMNYYPGKTIWYLLVSAGIFANGGGNLFTNGLNLFVCFVSFFNLGQSFIHGFQPIFPIEIAEVKLIEKDELTNLDENSLSSIAIEPITTNVPAYPITVASIVKENEFVVEQAENLVKVIITDPNTIENNNEQLQDFRETAYNTSPVDTKTIKKTENQETTCFVRSPTGAWDNDVWF